MPLKLVPPKTGRTPYWWIRGTHLGCYCERSSGTGDKRLAAQVLKRIERDIERGAFAEPTGPGFAAAAAAYMKAGGDRKFLAPLIQHFKSIPLADIDQIAIDTAAGMILPSAGAATRNRQVYTPVSAVMKRAGLDREVKRPIGWRGNKATSWLSIDQAQGLMAAAYDTDAEFGLFLTTLLLTGMRLGEALSLRLSQVDLDQQAIYLPKTKNGEPRRVYMPGDLVAAFERQPPRPKRKGGRSQEDAGIPFLARRPDAKVFRFNASGALRNLLTESMTAAGIALPPRQGGFHVLRHTWATWMRRYAGLDTTGLVATGAWRSRQSASRYEHLDMQEEAKRADLLPALRRVV